MDEGIGGNVVPGNSDAYQRVRTIGLLQGLANVYAVSLYRKSFN